ncbi:N-acetylmuramoyl-L-alanine amidase [Gordonia sp. NPDC003424]
MTLAAVLTATAACGGAENLPAATSSASRTSAPPPVAKPCAPTVIALDPGHSPAPIARFDPVTGAKMVDYPNGAEAADDMYVARSVQRMLETNSGYRAILVKTSLSDDADYRVRVHRAEQAGAALGVSIHTSPGDNAVFAQRVGLYREGPGPSGDPVRVTFTDAAVAGRSQRAAVRIAASRSSTEDHQVRVTDNDFGGRYPLWAGNIPIISLISTHVPWVYNEFGPASGGGGADPVAHADLDRYARGISDGITASTPPAHC